jgi:hypothetical protein
VDTRSSETADPEEGDASVATYQATSRAANAPDIEAAGYDLVFVRSEAKLIKGGQYLKDKVNGDPKLELYFNVISNDDENPGLMFEDGQAIEVSRLVGTGFNTTSKTTPGEVLFLKAILTKSEYEAFIEGAGTPDDEEDAPAGLVGRVVQGEVYVKDDGWPGVGSLFAPKGGQKGKPYSGK